MYILHVYVQRDGLAKPTVYVHTHAHAYRERGEVAYFSFTMTIITQIQTKNYTI